MFKYTKWSYISSLWFPHYPGYLEALWGMLCKCNSWSSKNDIQNKVCKIRSPGCAIKKRWALWFGVQKLRYLLPAKWSPPITESPMKMWITKSIGFQTNYGWWWTNFLQNNSWKKLRISNISTNMCIWGCAHNYTSAIYLAWITMNKNQITQYSASRHPFQHTQLCWSSFFKLEILRVLPGCHGC
jgi:hypothetical protein